MRIPPNYQQQAKEGLRMNYTMRYNGQSISFEGPSWLAHVWEEFCLLQAYLGTDGAPFCTQTAANLLERFWPFLRDNLHLSLDSRIQQVVKEYHETWEFHDMGIFTKHQVS